MASRTEARDDLAASAADGDHQDSILSRDLLTRSATGPDLHLDLDLDLDTARTYTRLLAIEKRISRDSETAYRKTAAKNALKIPLRR